MPNAGQVKLLLGPRGRARESIEPGLATPQAPRHPRRPM